MNVAAKAVGTRRVRFGSASSDRTSRKVWVKRAILAVFFVFLLAPIYWLLLMSFKTDQEIVTGLTLWPRDFTLANYATIFTTHSWWSSYINSAIYVTLNMIICLVVALPAAYAFSRYRFLGDRHLFFGC